MCIYILSLFVRHAKNVSEQTAREKVLSIESVPVAAVQANPVLPLEKTKIRLKCKRLTIPMLLNIKLGVNAYF